MAKMCFLWGLDDFFKPVCGIKEIPAFIFLML